MMHQEALLWGPSSSMGRSEIGGCQCICRMLKFSSDIISNIWPGDMGISSHTEFVALNDLLPSKNALTVMFSTQDPAAHSNTRAPNQCQGSDTYIGWSLIGT
ncbi:hypothetical protein BD779DRAFT_1758788, partial [Infundibulicybe gibba]